MAVSLAVPQNTGSAMAGSRRASASTPRLGATAASALEPANSRAMATNRRLRPTGASQAVSGGPASATTRANSVTSWPAAAALVPRSRASAGSRPTIRNSVVTMTKAATASTAVAALPWVAGMEGRASRFRDGAGDMRKDSGEKKQQARELI